jgi:hypothetical protein
MTGWIHFKQWEREWSSSLDLFCEFNFFTVFATVQVTFTSFLNSDSVYRTLYCKDRCQKRNQWHFLTLGEISMNVNKFCRIHCLNSVAHKKLRFLWFLLKDLTSRRLCSMEQYTENFDKKIFVHGSPSIPDYFCFCHF